MKTLTAALALVACLSMAAVAQTSYSGTTGTLMATESFTANVAGAGTSINDVEVTIDATHAFVGDLEIDIQSPGGTTVRLWDNTCSSSDDMMCVFADGGAAPGASCGPTTGTIAPQGPGALDDFDGEDPNGVWTITFNDTFPADTGGTLNAWSVDIDSAGAAAPGASTSTLLVTVVLLMAASAYFVVRP